MFEAKSFYNPISASGYLTPLQRKKLREKRNVELSVSPPEEKAKRKPSSHHPPPKKKAKRVDKNTEKRVDKIKEKRIDKIKGKRVVAWTELLSKRESVGERKFFKRSSPRKATFRPLSPKKKSRIGDPNKGPTVQEPLHEVSNVHQEALLDGQLHFEWPSDEDLQRRRQRAREELVLQRNSHSEEEPQENTEAPTVPKLYPIFLKTKNNKVADVENKRVPPPSRVVFAKESVGQTYIDAGQRDVGAHVCPTCNMLYTVAQEEDENLHTKYHNTYLANLRFPGWQKETVVRSFSDGRVILVKGNDKNLRKVQDILIIANRDLGFPSASAFPTNPDAVFLLFVSNEKRVCGCLVAEPIEAAFRVASEGWCAGTTPVKAICGVNRIWVATEARRRKVASRMLDCLRQSFLYGHVLSLGELAFTDPSPEGRLLAVAYTHTDNFLVYK